MRDADAPGLQPQAAAWLAAAPGRPSAHELPLAEARARVDAESVAAQAGEAVAAVEQLEVPVAGGAIGARLYRPLPGRLPVVVFLHGGGWVLGSLDSHDALCRALANASGAAVLAVGYRRAPEHRFPTAAHDAYAALRWIAREADALGLDGGRLALAGDSAGGNLAIAAALLARERRDPIVACLLLAYPVVTTNLTGLDAAYDGLVLSRAELCWHQRCYLGLPADRASPLVAPLDAADLRGLPPTLVVLAQCDPLRPPAERFARALAAADVPVEVSCCAGMPHGFLQYPAVLDAARAALDAAAAALRARLSPPAGAPRYAAASTSRSRPVSTS